MTMWYLPLLFILLVWWALGSPQSLGSGARARRSRAHPPYLDERLEDPPRAFDASVTRKVPTHPA